MKEGQGVREAARYAIQPNMWGFCGEDESQKILRDLVTDRESNLDLARETLHHHGFPHLNSFLRSIADEAGLDPFDERAVLSYWLGGELTEQIGTNTKSTLIRNYEGQISEDFAKQLEVVLPDNIYLTHLSQVALIAASGYEETEKTNTINHCMIAWGKVIDIDVVRKEAIVEREYLRKAVKGGYEVLAKKIKIKMDRDLTPELVQGDEVAVHLGYVAAVLARDEAESLRFWTRKVAQVI